MPDELLLTIAVPTYNGARTIARALATIVPQLEPGVELLVCDNASTDDTGDVVRTFTAEHPAIRYQRNEKNVGFDGNVDLCLRRARGRFVWIMSDDDIFCREDAVRQVLQVIRQHPEVVAIFADSRHPIRLDPADSGLCSTGAEFFRRIRFKCGLISSNIFRRDAWENAGVERHVGGGWIHMGFLVQALANAPSYVICEELVAQLVLEDQEGVTRWGGSGTFLMTGLNLVRIYREMPRLGYDRATVRAAYRTIKDGYPKNIPLAKAKGLRVGWPLLRDCAELYWWFPSFWLLDLPLLLLPGGIFRVARRISHALSERTQADGH